MAGLFWLELFWAQTVLVRLGCAILAQARSARKVPQTFGSSQVGLNWLAYLGSSPCLLLKQFWGDWVAPFWLKPVRPRNGPPNPWLKPGGQQPPSGPKPFLTGAQIKAPRDRAQIKVPHNIDAQLDKFGNPYMYMCMCVCMYVYGRGGRPLHADRTPRAARMQQLIVRTRPLLALALRSPARLCVTMSRSDEERKRRPRGWLNLGRRLVCRWRGGGCWTAAA